jgi:hypothetical protein
MDTIIEQKLSPSTLKITVLEALKKYNIDISEAEKEFDGFIERRRHADSSRRQPNTEKNCKNKTFIVIKKWTFRNLIFCNITYKKLEIILPDLKWKTMLLILYKVFM